MTKIHSSLLLSALFSVLFFSVGTVVAVADTDSNPPVITVANDTSSGDSSTYGNTYSDPGASAFDAEDNSSVSVTAAACCTDTGRPLPSGVFPPLGFYDKSPTGNYTITYTAQDSVGNVATAQRTVTINPADAVISIANPDDLAASKTVGEDYAVAWTLKDASGNDITSSAGGNVQVLVDGDAANGCNLPDNTAPVNRLLPDGVHYGCSVTSHITGVANIVVKYLGSTFYNAAEVDSGTGGGAPIGSANTTLSISDDTTDPSDFGSPYVVSWNVHVNSSGTVTPTGTVTISGSDGSSCSAAVGDGQCSITPSSAGPITLSASYSGDTNLNPSSSGSISHTINKADQTIDFPPISDMQFGAIDFTALATSNSSLPLTFFTASAAHACSNTGGLIHILGVGDCSITARQDSGSDDFNPAVPVTNSFTIGKANPTYAFMPDSIGTKSTTDADFDMSVTSTPNGVVGVFAVPESVCTLVGTSTGIRVHIVGEGTCTITASAGESDNFNSTSADISFLVSDDHTAPVVTITSGPANPATSSDAAFEFSSDDPTATFTCTIDDGKSEDCSSGVGFFGLKDGEHTFTVFGTDQHSNSSDVKSYTWTIDTTAPVITLNGTQGATVHIGVGGSYTEDGATAIDAVDGTSTAIISGDTVNTNVPATYIVRYNKTDNQQNVATEVIRTVIVDPSDLSALSAALVSTAALFPGTIEGDVPGNHVVGSFIALQIAYTVAGVVTSDSSQSVVDAALAALNTAVATFNAAIVPPSVVTSLATAKANAQVRVGSSPPESTTPGDHIIGARAILSAALAAANATAASSQSIVDTQTATLNAAVAAYDAALVPPSDLSSLMFASASASALLSVTENDVPGNHIVGSSATLQAAISAANSVTAASSQSDVDAAVVTLNSAVATFKAAIVPPSNVNSLNTAKSSAQAKITASSTESTTPGDHIIGARAILSTALAAANATNTSSQSTVDAQVTALNNAIATYDAAIVPPAPLNITAEQSQTASASTNSITITWSTTDHPATSRVLYGTVSISDEQAKTAGTPNYSYANSTTEDSTMVTSHSVTISGLTAGTTYFVRAVSHGSPEVVGPQIQVSTNSPAPVVSSGGGGGGGGGGGIICTTGTNFFAGYCPVATSTATTTSTTGGAATTTATTTSASSQTGTVLGASTYHFVRTLRKGMKGDDVKALQQFLKDAGYFNDDISGNFGKVTFAALVKYQIANGLEGVGYTGPLTLNLLNRGNNATATTTLSDAQRATLIQQLQDAIAKIFAQIKALATTTTVSTTTQ